MLGLPIQNKLYTEFFTQFKGSINDHVEFLTPYGNICDADSPCWNKWNNYEVKGARCRITVGGIANLDWCTRPTEP